MNTVQLPKRFLKKYRDFFLPVAQLRYARNENNQPVGVVLVDNQGYAGYSMVNLKAGDSFDKVKGIYKALCRLGSRNTLNDLKRKFYPDHSACSPEYAVNADAMYAAVIEVEKWQDETE